MSGGNRQIGKTEKTSGGSSFFKEYRDYVRSMNSSQRFRYYLLQAAVVVSIIIIIVAMIAKTWIVLPDVPVENEIYPTTIPSYQGGSTSSGNLSNSDGEDVESTEFSLDGAEMPSASQSGRREGVYTFLVAGRDEVSGSMDTMILVTYDTINKTIDAMSLLRDTMVNTSSSNKKLTHVYSYNKGSDKATQEANGVAALKTQVAKLTGIVPDFHVLVEWEAVGELVDAIGGVWFEVPYDMKYDDPYQDLHIDQKAGYRLLTGEDAMEVVRHRQNNNGWNIGDVGRVGVQQDFLIAVAQTCLKPEILTKASALVEIFKNNVSTDLTIGNLLAFAQCLYGMDVETGINMYSMPYYNLGYWNGAAYVGVSQTAMVNLLNEGMNPYLSNITASDLQLLYSNGNGTFSVTTGSLADSRLSVVPTVTVEPTEEAEPEPEEGAVGQPDPELPDPDSVLGGLLGESIGGSSSSTSTGSSSSSSSTGSSSSSSSTGSTGSTDTGSTGSTDTGSTGSTDTGSTGSTDTGSTGSTDTGSAGSTDTGSAGSTDTGSTGSTDTGSTGSTDTGSTGSTDTGSTGSTDTGSTGSTDTGSTDTSIPGMDTIPTEPEVLAPVG